MAQRHQPLTVPPFEAAPIIGTGGTTGRLPRIRSVQGHRSVQTVAIFQKKPRVFMEYLLLIALDIAVDGQHVSTHPSRSDLLTI